MAFAGSPEIPDLLLPLSEAEANEVRQANREWLDEYLERAKRHRLVRVNADALLTREEVRITLFDGRFFRIRVGERELHGCDSEPSHFTWTGRFSDPPFSAEDLLAMNPHIRNLEGAKRIYDGMMAIPFSGSLHLKDLATGGSWPVPHNCIGDYCACRPPEAVPGTTPFYAVRGRFPGRYSLRPIEHDPEYHVLVELDPAYEGPKRKM